MMQINVFPPIYYISMKRVSKLGLLYFILSILGILVSLVSSVEFDSAKMDSLWLYFSLLMCFLGVFVEMHSYPYCNLSSWYFEIINDEIVVYNHKQIVQRTIPLDSIRVVHKQKIADWFWKKSRTDSEYKALETDYVCLFLGSRSEMPAFVPFRKLFRRSDFFMFCYTQEAYSYLVTKLGQYFTERRLLGSFHDNIQQPVFSQCKEVWYC